MLRYVMKEIYKDWMKAPVDHTHKSFIEMCAKQFKLSEQEIEKRLNTCNWYKRQ